MSLLDRFRKLIKKLKINRKKNKYLTIIRKRNKKKKEDN
jgi:hypothetical protein